MMSAFSGGATGFCESLTATLSVRARRALDPRNGMSKPMIIGRCATLGPGPSFLLLLLLLLLLILIFGFNSSTAEYAKEQE